jgi:hypothetical protein
MTIRAVAMGLIHFVRTSPRKDNTHGSLQESYMSCTHRAIAAHHSFSVPAPNMGQSFEYLKTA